MDGSEADKLWVSNIQDFLKATKDTIYSNNARIEHTEDRLSSIEKEHAKTTAVLENIVGRLERQDERFESLFKAIGAIKDSNNINSKTNWGVLASWAGVIITLMTTIGWLTITPIHHTIKDMKEVSKNDFKNFDETLQREMRLLDITLQREMALNDKHNNILIDRNIADIKELKTWTIDHDQRVSGLNSRQSAEIEHLNNRVNIFDEEQRRRTNKVYE